MSMDDKVELNATPSEPEADAKRDRQLADSKEFLGMGVAIGVVGAASAAAVGAACPMCVVAAPALIGAGLFKRWQAFRK